MQYVEKHPSCAFPKIGLRLKVLFTNSSFNVPAGCAISGVATHAHVLRIETGRVWITVEGGSRDFWLGVGDTLAVFPGYLIVIEADKVGSRIDVMPCTDVGIEPDKTGSSIAGEP